MVSRRRGLALIEVLAAAALLAVLGAVCAMVLREARLAMPAVERGGSGVEALELERLAEALLEESDGLDVFTAGGPTSAVVAWPQHPDRPAVRLERLEPAQLGEGQRHAWIAFTCGEVTIWRRIELVVAPRGEDP
jgi:NADPH-dependent ferric siderophore reductase